MEQLSWQLVLHCRRFYPKAVPDFKPPIKSPLGNLLAKAFLPFALWWGYYDAIEVDEESRLRLMSLRGKRAIICPNHSKGHDPGIIYWLRRFLHEDFRFLAAREIFDRWHGFLGWLIQRVGAYSVERDICDRPAILTTVKLLLDGKHKLVVFPEGTVSNRSDCLLPVERGLTRVFLAAAAALEHTEGGGTLYLVPIGLRYRYVQDISGNLSNALVRIELTLGISDHRGNLQSRFQRARRLTIERLPSMRQGRSARWIAAASDDEQDTLKKTLSSFGNHNLSQENLAGGIDLIERMMYTRVTQKGHRRVRLRVGEPIDLCAYLVKYSQDRHAAAELLAVDLEQQLADLTGVPMPTARWPLSA